MQKICNIPQELNFLAPLTCTSLTRLGSIHDGGYLIPKSAINLTKTLISLGINWDWSFDAAFQEANPDVQVHGYDHTISSSTFRKNFIVGILKFLIFRNNLNNVLSRYSLYKNYKNFYIKKNTHFKEKVHNRNDFSNYVILETILQRVTDFPAFLKCDIEGGEYRIIDDILDNADKFVGIIIEFHETEPFRRNFTESIRKLQSSFDIVHLHANNCSGVSSDGLPEVLEITFIHKNYCEYMVRSTFDLPLPGLDAPCNPNAVDYLLKWNSCVGCD
jgi:hypothetical protein